MLTLTLDIADWERDNERGSDELEHDTDNAAFTAADAGIEEAQANHPYTDRTRNLTGSAHVEPADDGGPGADMVWPAEYADYVDKGTERSRPYPFTPQAEDRAQASLDRSLETAVDRFVKTAGS